MRITNFLIAIAMLCLAGCSTTLQTKTNASAEATANLSVSNKPIGGNIQNTMDASDKDKLSHALDKPLGKATQWQNSRSGITYSVVPTKKLTVKENHFCREYFLTATHNNAKNEFTGVACVSPADNNWQAMD